MQGRMFCLIGIAENPHGKSAIGQACDTGVLTQAEGEIIAHAPIIEFGAIRQLRPGRFQIALTKLRKAKTVMAQNNCRWVIRADAKVQQLPAQIAGDGAIAPSDVEALHAKQRRYDLRRVTNFLAQRAGP